MRGAAYAAFMPISEPETRRSAGLRITAKKREFTMTHKRHTRNMLFALALMTMATLPATSCTFGREFREAAGPALQSGVTSILTGLVNGVFAAIEPETDAEAEGG